MHIFQSLSAYKISQYTTNTNRKSSKIKKLDTFYNRKIKKCSKIVDPIKIHNKPLQF